MKTIRESEVKAVNLQCSLNAVHNRRFMKKIYNSTQDYRYLFVRTVDADTCDRLRWWLDKQLRLNWQVRGHLLRAKCDVLDEGPGVFGQEEGSW